MATYRCSSCGGLCGGRGCPRCGSVNVQELWPIDRSGVAGDEQSRHTLSGAQLISPDQLAEAAAQGAL